MSEAREQTAVIQWAHLMENKYPQLKMLYHIPNGGSRNAREAHNLKMQGVRAGVPDLHLPVARGGYHSLWLEMKYGKNKPTALQKEYMEFLKNEGHCVHVCYSADEAIETICDYLNLGEYNV